MEQKVKCRQCGRFAPINDYRLDPVFGKMVCSACIKERRMREDVHREVNAQRQAKKKGMEEVAEKPAGWDIEDEFLSKVYASKMKNTVQVEHISGDKVKYKCPKCAYKFIYDTGRKMPPGCPYCGTGIGKIMF